MICPHGPGCSVVAKVWWLAPDGDVYQSLGLRYDPARGCVDLLACFGEDWWSEGSVEDSVDPPESWRVELQVNDELCPDELFTRLASLHASVFEVLSGDQASQLIWDDSWKPGPERTELWRPVDLGAGIEPFAVRR